MLPQADGGEAAQSVCRTHHHLRADILSLEKEIRRYGIGRCETAHLNPIQSSCTIYQSLVVSNLYPDARQIECHLTQDVSSVKPFKITEKNALKIDIGRIVNSR